MDNKNAKLALGTLFLNLAVAAHQEPLQEGLADAYQQLTALYAEVLSASSGVQDEVLYRYFVGLGTLLTVRGESEVIVYYIYIYIYGFILV